MFHELDHVQGNPNADSMTVASQVEQDCRGAEVPTQDATVPDQLPVQSN